MHLSHPNMSLVQTTSISRSYGLAEFHHMIRRSVKVHLISNGLTHHSTAAGNQRIREIYQNNKTPQGQVVKRHGKSEILHSLTL